MNLEQLKNSRIVYDDQFMIIYNLYKLTISSTQIEIMIQLIFDIKGKVFVEWDWVWI